MYIIYKATFSNGKSYIGLTNNFHKRKIKHIWDAKNVNKYPINKAINKYGADDITWTFLEEGIESLELACEFEIKYISKYNTFKGNGYNANIGGNQNIKPNKYDEDILLNISSKYKSKAEWRRLDSKSHSACRKNYPETYKKCIEHMNRPDSVKIWTLEAVVNDAIKYDTLKEWGINSPSAYTMAYRKGYIDEVKKFVKPQRVRWSEKLIKEDVLKYKTKTEWRRNSPSSYAKARKLGIVKEIYNTHFKKES